MPRFRDSSDHGLMTKCIKWAKAVIGREHHAHWFKTLDHPDARLIAAAPELLDSLKELRDWYKDATGLPAVAANAAIAKAEGGGE